MGANPGDCLMLARCSPCTVTAHLHAASEFSGRVLAADTKDPLPKVTVEAIRVSYDSGTMTSRTFASEVSGSEGTLHPEATDSRTIFLSVYACAARGYPHHSGYE